MQDEISLFSNRGADVSEGELKLNKGLVRSLKKIYKVSMWVYLYIFIKCVQYTKSRNEY